MGSRRARTGAAAAAVAALALTAAGCGGGGITEARLEAAVGPEFRNLYVRQQIVLHGEHNGVTPDAWAHCTESGSVNDWACVVRWPSGGGIIRPISYEVEVRSNGCFTAQGPAGVVGQQRVAGADGERHTNPLYAFDGCFDTFR
ncbi:MULTISPECIES: hypothetical protein [Streptomyces]|uniref:Lipoprotein n=1 Tax=Streptomyces morookaense TaxID=1970 RepID=A0A7Y7B1N7_STRMO|nr:MULTISPECIES: hypothetical protein [Streptomyces]MCC2278062.1 hypothetical protein [Streptomyces sp. ET3-23]NVK77390.1 hypothetical protein [Streptomyces morookaense]GHF21460.1 hypothetical protein GCM10010359_23670 [Streptomyces morookaense]